jgi:D-sedoheptulose 7-phosphate isomerase
VDLSAREFLADRAERFRAVSGSAFPEHVEVVTQAALDCLNRGGKILVFGNGGSAALAVHFSGELVGRFRQDRRPLPAIALVNDLSAMTAIANDYSFGEIFSRQLEGVGKADDLALGLTTSGRSENVVNALTHARNLGIFSAVLTGGAGGPAAKAADMAAIISSEDTDFIQEAHEAALHYMCHRLDTLFCKEPSA